MRISDWSSDVCSSDLSFYKVNTGAGKHAPPLSADQPYYAIIEMLGSQQERDTELFETVLGEAGERGFFDDAVLARSEVQRQHIRSEEHTSELQSLMRISYAVFCLKKKNTENYNNSMLVEVYNMQKELKRSTIT